MNLVQLVFRNTSTLDYSIPLLCELRREYPNANLSVLYCTLNKKQILRNSKYYEKLFSNYNINQYDYSSLLTKKNFLTKLINGLLFSTSYSDNISFKTFLKNPLFLKGKVIKFIFAGFRKKLENSYLKKIINKKNIISQLNPDIVLHDHRARIDFCDKENFLYFFEKKKIPVVLVPHAAHVDTETAEFMKFAFSKQPFPDYCDHWSSFKYAKPYLMSPNLKEKFTLIGHPGLDSKWLMPKKDLKKKFRRKILQNEKINCLLLIRKILPEEVSRNPGNIPDYLEFKEAVALVKNIKMALEKTNLEINFIIKPHPTSSFPENIRVMSQAEINHYQISYEPFFSILDDVDFVITEFTTSIAFPVLSKIPTILLNSPLQDFVHSSWDKLKELYSNMYYFEKSPNKLLKNTLDKLINDVLSDSDKLTSVEKDSNHFRNFYLDGAINNALERINKIYN